jgi:glucose-1-phosphatase
MNAPAVVLFDLGNVLVGIRPAGFTDFLGIERTAARERYKRPIIETVQRYEAGLISTGEYLNKIGRLFDGRYSREELASAMLNVIGEPVPGMEALVGSVASSRRIALVSNTNELHFSYCREHLPALRYFQHFYLSYELRASKPNPLYYKKVLEELKTSPDSVVFVDDMAENVDGAIAAGMKGLLFTTPQHLSTELGALGILQSNK